MQVVKAYPDGMFSWIDLATNDAAGAKEFYSGLFGWEFEDRPIPDGGVYIMAKLHGHNVAGMTEMDGAEMEAQGMPPLWSSYINHSDVDGIAKKVEQAGGNAMMPPMDVMEEGRMGFFQDPLGAPFGVWQPKNHTGAELVNIPGALVWNELQIKNAEPAKKFYSDVFGWESSEDGNGYNMFGIDGRIQAGMIVLDESYPVPPHWAVYFMVDDVAKSTEKLKELGGTAMIENNPAGEMGAFTAAMDPQGASFVIMEFSGPVDAPPGY